VHSRILVNHKNLSEVLAACGLPILADCLDSPVTRCRFTQTKTVVCNDNVFRSMAFEFEHPDYQNLLQRIAGFDVARVDGKIALTEHGNEVITLDWFDMGGFVGDKGNFSKADKSAFVKLHHPVFAELVSANENLFSLSTETTETNYLANLSQLKKNYIDAGGVYDSVDTKVFARDFLLIVALQNFRSMMTQLVSEGSVVYGLATEWTPPEGLFAALVGGGVCKKYEATVKGFGKDGLVLAVATEVADEQMTL
jgi:hypothetical protein